MVVEPPLEVFFLLFLARAREGGGVVSAGVAQAEIMRGNRIKRARDL